MRLQREHARLWLLQHSLSHVIAVFIPGPRRDTIIISLYNNVSLYVCIQMIKGVCRRWTLMTHRGKVYTRLIKSLKCRRLTFYYWRQILFICYHRSVSASLAWLLSNQANFEIIASKCQMQPGPPVISRLHETRTLWNDLQSNVWNG